MSDNEAGAEARDGGAERAAGQSGKAAGSQTLARGLLALELVAGQPRGLAVQDLAQHLGVHRTIAYRILVTLAEHHLVVRASDGRYRAGSGTVTLARGYAAGVREAALPVLRRTAEQLGATVALVAAEGDEAVAVAVAEPLSVNYLLSYRVGAAGLALAAAPAARTGRVPRGDAGARPGLRPDLRPDRTRSVRRRRAAPPGRPGAAHVRQPHHLARRRRRRLPADDAGGRRGDLGPGLIPHRRRPGPAR
ncbi:helix-turn-helix domain-containing protein [Streptomyces albidoflavus]